LAALRAEAARLAAEEASAHAAAEALAKSYSPLRAEAEMLGDLFSTAGGRGWKESAEWRESSGDCSQGAGNDDVRGWHGVQCGPRREVSLSDGGVPASPGHPRPQRPKRGKVVRLELNANALKGHLPSFLDEVAAAQEAHDLAHSEHAATMAAVGCGGSRSSSSSSSSSSSGGGGSSSSALTLAATHPQATEWELQYQGPKCVDPVSGLLVPAPVGWGRLAGLRVLSCSHNGLTGNLPPDLAVLENLEILNLSVNKFKGPIPPEWGQLKKLTHLWLFANNLSGPALPVELASSTGCTRLKSIRLARNSLEGPLPSGLGSLAELEELDLERNRIGGELPGEGMAKLLKLKRLRVNGNRLRGPLPVNFLDVLTKLKDIRLYHNQFDEHTVSRCGVMRTVSNEKDLTDVKY